MITIGAIILEVALSLSLSLGHGKFRPENPKVNYSSYCHWSDFKTWTCFNLDNKLVSQTHE